MTLQIIIGEEKELWAKAYYFGVLKPGILFTNSSLEYYIVNKKLLL